MIREMLTSAAVVALLMTAGAASGLAQSSSPAPTAKEQKAGPGMMHAQQRRMSKDMSQDRQMAKGRMGQRGHMMDNVGDKLNACQQRPAAERQACMDSAVHPRSKGQ